MQNTKPTYKPKVCSSCGQRETYLLPIDRGTTLIVKAFAAAVRRKGINLIHIEKEMEVPRKEWTYARAVSEGVLTSVQIGNRTRARVHGLIAMVHDEPGNWCLTSKGAKFLRGEPVQRYAIVQKSKEGARSHKEDYWEPDLNMVCVSDFTAQDEPWEGINFDIVEGRVVAPPGPAEPAKVESVQRPML